MNSSPFRLLPWEHGGVSPAPSRVIEARVEGELRRFDVKWRAGRAFFRLADSDDNRVWASWNGVVENELASAIEAGEIGRYFAIERGFSTQTVSADFATEVKARRGSYDLFGQTSLAVIVNDEHRGRAQEWCGGPWLDFALPARAAISSGAHKPSIWHRGWNVAGLRGALANLAGELAFRVFEPNLDEDGELRFASGSVEMLQRLYQAAFLVCAPDRFKINPWLRNYRRGGFTLIKAESAQDRARSSDSYFAPEPLLTAFVLHNLPVGGAWRCVRRQAETAPQPARKLSRFLARKTPTTLAPVPNSALQRIDFRFDAHSVRFEFEIALDSSAHEQLEARLFLRDWMRENLTATQFVRLKKYIEAPL